MRKSAPVRQFSLHVDTPQRRKNFKKQFSEDDSKEKWMQVISPGISVCAKKRENLPVTKQAWLEENAQSIMHAVNNDRNDEGIVVKKCKEIKRPLTSKIVKQTLNKESILLSHQELAERLRQAWKEREKEKQNLNIFLNHNIKDKFEDDFNDLTDSECAVSTEINKNQIKKTQSNVPIQQESTDNAYKSIFQKRMRRTHSVDESLRDYMYSPNRGSENKVKSVVVVPLVDSLKAKEHVSSNTVAVNKFNDGKLKLLPKQDQCTLKNDQQLLKNHKTANLSFDENKPINVIIRPMTAVTKREAFRSRANSAFNTSNSSSNNMSVFKDNPRPPLIRSSSVPLKQISPKPCFVAVKRRLKSASKKKDKSVKSGNKYESPDDTDDKCKNRKLQRCVSALGPDIITMVSLISPEESENEEQAEPEKIKPKVASALAKPLSMERSDKNEAQKNYNFRKAVKTVSFQQSSIHAVRSFSASFPARRGSVVTTLMLNNSNFDKAPNISAVHEKRATVESSTDDVREPKRRLLRTNSNTLNSSLGAEEDNAVAKPIETNENDTHHSKTDCIVPIDSQTSSAKLDIDEDIHENSEGKESDAQPKFDTPKEKQCWEICVYYQTFERLLEITQHCTFLESNDTKTPSSIVYLKRNQQWVPFKLL
ncbi:hypothetical protein RN001_009791 [Aquatica leii]|uniref:Uncharacterized protein n=1 Tax=Aquatica leii TaxID=1421715 RepID=A0AAN7P017_9COLE|nr:hypothetical protein RN001_009791 [Aquatica leii]